MIITIVLYVLCIGLFFVNNTYHRKNQQLIKELKRLNEKQSEFIDEQAAEYREVLIFSVRAIIKEAIEKEDYETAKKCKDILDRYETDNSNSGRN